MPSCNNLSYMLNALLTEHLATTTAVFYTLATTGKTKNFLYHSIFKKYNFLLLITLFEAETMETAVNRNKDRNYCIGLLLWQDKQGHALSNWVWQSLHEQRRTAQGVQVPAHCQSSSSEPEHTWYKERTNSASVFSDLFLAHVFVHTHTPNK